MLNEVVTKAPQIKLLKCWLRYEKPKEMFKCENATLLKLYCYYLKL